MRRFILCAILAFLTMAIHTYPVKIDSWNVEKDVQPLAGEGVGYLAGAMPLIERLEEFRSPYNADSFSQECARQVLQQSHQ
ncbi:MAG: hypothetical protein R6T89_07040, partial [Candidatus Syntrophosphaera sp.]